jgi:hypothetical protein
MLIPGIVAGLSVIAGTVTVGDIYSCAGHTTSQHAVGETALVEPIATGTGGLVAAFDQGRRQVLILETGEEGAPRTMACTSPATSGAILCTADSDRTVIVFFRDGTFTRSVQADDPERWVTTQGTCKPRRDVLAVLQENRPSSAPPLETRAVAS